MSASKKGILHKPNNSRYSVRQNQAEMLPDINVPRIAKTKMVSKEGVVTQTPIKINKKTYRDQKIDATSTTEGIKTMSKEDFRVNELEIVDGRDTAKTADQKFES